MFDKRGVEIKHKLKAYFGKERANGSPKDFWRGCRMFVNGMEVQPWYMIIPPKPLKKKRIASFSSAR